MLRAVGTRSRTVFVTGTWDVGDLPSEAAERRVLTALAKPWGGGLRFPQFDAVSPLILDDGSRCDPRAESADRAAL